MLKISCSGRLQSLASSASSILRAAAKRIASTMRLSSSSIARVCLTFFFQDVFVDEVFDEAGEFFGFHADDFREFFEGAWFGCAGVFDEVAYDVEGVFVKDLFLCLECFKAKVGVVQFCLEVVHELFEVGRGQGDLFRAHDFNAAGQIVKAKVKEVGEFFEGDVKFDELAKEFVLLDGFGVFFDLDVHAFGFEAFDVVA